MQISGLSTLPITPAQSQRPDVVERLQRDTRQETNRSEDERSRSTEDRFGQLLSNNSDSPQRVGSSNRASELISRRQAEDDSLPLSTRRALQTFSENAPSPGQQLGIELAGIDTFV